MAALPVGTDPDDEAGRILADYLRNLGARWQAATPEERNRMARHLFAEVWVVNKTAVAVTPRPEFRPFLELADAGTQVREGLSTEMSLRRKRRGSVTRVHPAGAGPDRRLPIGSLSLEGRVA